MVAVASPSKKSAAKKPARSAKPALHPTYNEMISKSIATLKERNGSSRQKIAKHIIANYKGLGEDTKVNMHIKLALKKALAAGTIVHTKGTGCSGSFKMAVKAKVAAAPKKKTVVKKKPAATKPKSTKKPAAKKAKTPTKAKKAKTPTKAKKSPKKVKAVVKKAPAAKAPAKKTKKSPAKKQKAKK